MRRSARTESIGGSSGSAHATATERPVLAARRCATLAPTESPLPLTSVATGGSALMPACDRYCTEHPVCAPVIAGRICSHVLMLTLRAEEIKQLLHPAMKRA